MHMSWNCPSWPPNNVLSPSIASPQDLGVSTIDIIIANVELKGS